MSTKAKTWLIIAILFIVGGLLLAGVGTAMGGTWSYSYFFKDGHINFSKNSDNYVSEKKIVSDFSKLNVTAGTVDVIIEKGADECSVFYYVPENMVPTIDDGDTLTIEVPKQTSFFDFFNFNTGESPYIKITVPSDDEKKFDISTSTGDVNIVRLSFYGKIGSSTGDITLNTTSLGDVTLSTSTGDMFINGVRSSGVEISTSTGETRISDSVIDKLVSKTSTGDIDIIGSEFNRIQIDGSTSDVTLTSTKVEDIKIDVSTGECELELLGNASDYSCKLNSSTGDIDYDRHEYEKRYSNDGTGKGTISIETSTGDIEVRFR